ncbi:cupin domain-containing protein [Candidatus Synechococcus calcipolaris G9]|uniref:Cupin domain-containing protein n=1 Tax=Candidatus Synechococcus calcipolaris G9 TaxID=1497997 RepID=A0ABT6EZG1_9SYNE|nr:cupin domain-containing protein [Candidatus Synechococcus calcipolaris]MDG2990960.1 cupin domain-containing protein [Candidatus Synechococcus calcipolaris G9]
MKIKPLVMLAIALVGGLYLLSFNVRTSVAQDANPLLDINEINKVRVSNIDTNFPDFSTNEQVNLAQRSPALGQAAAATHPRFSCDPRQVDVHQYSGGVISYCRNEQLTAAETDSARVDIQPNAARTPHWHNTWEEQILLSGTATTTMIDPTGQSYQERLEPGTIVVIPAGWTHWSETLGNQTASFILVFPAGFKTFELSDSMVKLNPAIMAAMMGEELSNVKHNRDKLVLLKSPNP